MTVLASCTLHAEEDKHPASHPFVAEQRRPFVIAHRAGCGLWPENTLEAVRNVMDRHPQAVVEVDVRGTGDGNIVVIHDEDVKRTTDGSGLIRKKTLAEIRALDAGYCFSPSAHGGTGHGCRQPMNDATKFPYRGKGVRIPTLDELLSAIKPGTFLSVEVKDDDVTVADAVATLLSAHPAEKLIVGSRHGDVSKRLRERLPRAAHYASESAARCHVGWAASHLPGTFCSGEYDVLALPTAYIPLGRVSRYAHQRRMAVAAFTLNDENAIAATLRLGVDAVITDFPDRAERAISTLGNPLR